MSTFASKTELDCLKKKVCDLANTPSGLSEQDVIDLISASPDLDEQTLTEIEDANGVTTGIQISNGNIISIDHPPEYEPCEKIVTTRVAVRALRNSGNLEAGCQYEIPYDRTCLAGSSICLTALGPNKFSHDVDVQTPFDNMPWEGRYDLDTGRLVSLQDNRGNYARGTVGLEVDQFPWGNANWTETIVQNADIIVPCDTTFRSLNNRFESDSYANFTGATGYMYYSSLRDNSNLRLDGSTGLRINALTMDQQGRLDARTAADLYVLNGSVRGGYVLATGSTDFRLVYTTVQDNAQVRYTGGDRNWNYYSTYSSNGIVRQLAGEILNYYTNIDSFGEVRNEAGAGTMQNYGLAYQSRGYHRNYSTALIRNYYLTLSARGEIQHKDATAQTNYYSTAQNYGRIIAEGTTSRFYAINVDTQSIFTMQAGNHYRNNIDGLAYITAPFNTRSVQVHGRITQTLSAANSNTGWGYWGSTLV